MSAFQEKNGLLICVDQHTKGVDHVVGLIGPTNGGNWEYYGFLRLPKSRLKNALSLTLPENFLPNSSDANEFLVCSSVDGCDRNDTSSFFSAFAANWQAIEPHLEAWSDLEEKLTKSNVRYSAMEQVIRQDIFANPDSYRIESVGLFVDSVGRNASQFYISDARSLRRWTLVFSEEAGLIQLQSFMRLFQ